MKSNIILVGSGTMAVNYAKVLNSFDLKYEIVGRGQISGENFNKIIGKKYFWVD